MSRKRPAKTPPIPAPVFLREIAKLLSAAAHEGLEENRQIQRDTRRQLHRTRHMLQEGRAAGLDKQATAQHDQTNAMIRDQLSDLQTDILNNRANVRRLLSTLAIVEGNAAQALISLDRGDVRIAGCLVRSAAEVFGGIDREVSQRMLHDLDLIAGAV